MAQGTAVYWHEFLLKVGDGADPEVFNGICGITSHEITIASETSSTMMPDCADAKKPMFAIKRVKSQSAQIDCTATYSWESHELLMNWAQSGAVKNAKLMAVPDDDDNLDTGAIEVIAGPVIMTNFKFSGSHGEGYTATFTLDFADRPVNTLAA